MKTKKRKHHRPWLTPTGVEIPTPDLQKISKSWDTATWANYLKWFETGRKEALITPVVYAIIGDEQIESIFEQFAQAPSQESRDQCDQLLSALPPIEAEVLRLAFVEGRTEVEVAFALKRSRSGVNLLKNKAISRLKRGNHGDEMAARRFMRGANSSSLVDEPSIWDQTLSSPIREARTYDPNHHKVEFEMITWSSLRVALLELPEVAQRILYLRYWCNFSTSQTARHLGRGINVVQEIETSSISKVKRTALVLETGTNFGGGQCN